MVSRIHTHRLLGALLHSWGQFYQIFQSLVWNIIEQHFENYFVCLLSPPFLHFNWKLEQRAIRVPNDRFCSRFPDIYGLSCIRGYALVFFQPPHPACDTLFDSPLATLSYYVTPFLSPDLPTRQFLLFESPTP